SGGDVNLRSGGLAINQPLFTGTGTVRLLESGAVSQSAASPITASFLSVTDNVGNVVLETTNAVSNLAVNLTGAGEALSFNDSFIGLTVGSVGAAAVADDPATLFGATVTGITTNSGDVNLNSSGGLGLTNAVGAGSATVRLIA